VRANAASASTTEAAFEVDAAAVSAIDAAGVQLLLALAQALQSIQHVLRLRHPSPVLVDACSLLGAGHLLADPTMNGSPA
jgi:anti-anti-sigma regulatory factor